MKKFAVFLIIAVTLLAPLSAVAEYNSATAADYLLAKADSSWSTMGLVALGVDNIPSDYLKAVNGSSAIDYAAPILAITALNLDPRAYGNKDYVAELKSFDSNNQLGDVSTINDDIFGLLALISAGEQVSDPVLGNAKNYILSSQNSDGGWGFAVNGSSDSNMTAAAIVALIAGGVSNSDSVIGKAFDYLKTAQNNDGGFTYDPNSSFGTASDSSSTAWVIWALNAASESLSDWAKDGNTPVEYLEGNQADSGYFKYQSNSQEDAFSAVTTAYAAIALSGKTLPLKVFSGSPAFEFRIEGKDQTVCSGQTQGPSALDIVKNASLLCDFTYNIQQTGFGPYLDQIAGDKAEGLIGWMYLVNYLSPPVGAADYELASGDSVLWYYGDFNWKPSRLSLSSSKVESNASSTALVEYLDNGAWSGLSDAAIYYGASSATSDSGGNALITAADGYYKVYAEKEGYIRSNTVALTVGESFGSDVSLSVNLKKGEVLGETVSFAVDQSFLDFGTLNSGQSGTKILTISNTGTVDITVQSIVKGDPVFLDNLTFDNQAWPNFSKNIAIETSQAIDATLAVPSSNTVEGSQSGTITFWATAE